MHEMSLALSLMDELLRIAAQQGAVKIIEVDVECGVLQQVVPEALQVAFEAASVATIAADATLRIREVPVAARCRLCGHEYGAALDDYLCPRCAQADVEIVAGRDLVLRSVVCETESGKS